MHRKYLLTLTLLGLASCGDTGTTLIGPAQTATNIILSSDAMSFSSLGEAQELTASVTDQNGTVMPAAAVTWSTSADQVASVSTDGSVAAVGNGTAIITATSGSVNGTAAVTVAQLPASITLSQGTPLALAGPGDEATLTAVVQDAGDTEIPGATLAWSSDDETIATVSGGDVEAVGGGAATVTAAADGASGPVTATLDLTVGDAVLIDANGGQFSLSGGAVNLAVPAGAVSTPVFVNAEAALALPALPLAIPGTAFDLTPDGLDFSQPVTLTIAYDPTDIPAGVPENELRIHKVVGDEYVEIDGATVNLSGDTASGSIDGFSIYAIVPRIRVTTTTLPAGSEGVTYTGALSAVGGDGSYEWAVTTGSLPAGLTLATSGNITGTPTSTETSDFTVEVTSGGQTKLQSLSIAVDGTLSVTTTSLPDGFLNLEYSDMLAAAGGDGSYSWTIAPGSGPLPDGLAVAPNGMITGTPTTGGVSTFTVSVTSGTQTAERELSITVQSALTITTTTLAEGSVGVAYGNPALIAGGGTGAYAWALAAGSGALPAGLTLGTDGNLTGTPTTAGLFNFTVEVTSGSETAQQALSITIQALAVTTSSLPDGRPNIDYGVVPLAAAGGDGNYAWSVASGALPTGMSLATNGNITGVPTVLETAVFTVEVESAGLTAQAALSITVEPSLNLSVDVVHLNQGSQALDGSIGGIAERPGLLRIFVQANEANSETPEVRVRLYDGATLLREEVLSAPLSSVPVTPDVENLSDSWNLTLTAAEIVPGLSVEVLVDPSASIQENDRSDNTYPLGGGTLDLDVREREPLNLLFIPIQSTFHNTLGSLTAANADDFLESTWQWLPTSPISWNMHAAFSSGEDLTTAEGWSTLLSDIQALRTAEGATDEYYHGIIGDFSGIRYGGLAYRPSSPNSRSRSGLSYDRWPFAKETIGHELGHNLGRRHAPCGNPNGPDPDYPYANADIGVPGYDIITGDLVPSDNADFMSYCRNEWTSDYTYGAIRDWRIADPLADPGTSASRAAPRRGVLLWGRVHSGGVDLNPAITLDAVPSLPSANGPNTIRGLAPDGRVLFSYAFEGTPIADTPDPNERHFAFFVPLDPTSLDLLDRIIVDSPQGTAAQSAASDNGQPAAVSAAAAPPTITPVSGGAVRVQWNAAHYPMAVVRDRDTGQILMFARGGDAVTALGGTSLERLEVVVSDGVKSRELGR